MSGSDTNPYLFDKRRVARSFNRAASRYEEHATLQRTVAGHIMERLDLFTVTPRTILDIGGGTGRDARLLARRFRGARVIVCDLALDMLLEARRRRPRLWSRQRYLCTDAERLPLAEASVDLVYSNLTLQWCNSLDSVFTEIRRVLRPEGLVLFSTLGPDTLKELRASWRQVDDKVHVHAFMDMHDIGDALIRAGLSGPVIDVEHFTLTYADVYGLMRDLKALGAANATYGRPHALLGKRSLNRFIQAYEVYRRDGVLPATHEVVYGHAWAPVSGTRPQDGSTVVSFPIADIKRRGAGVDR